ncbi:MAG: hypothetical protein ACYC6A_24990 [Armatimonadota bacterium]
MQIVAHSVVPSNPVPYLHLGYLSASQYNYWTKGLPEPVISAGQILMFFAVIACFTGLGMFVVYTRRSLLAMLVGILLFLGGIAGFVIGQGMRDAQNTRVLMPAARSVQP